LKEDGKDSSFMREIGKNLRAIEKNTNRQPNRLQKKAKENNPKETKIVSHATPFSETESKQIDSHASQFSAIRSIKIVGKCRQFLSNERNTGKCPVIFATKVNKFSPVGENLERKNEQNAISPYRIYIIEESKIVAPVTQFSETEESKIFNTLLTFGIA